MASDSREPEKKRKGEKMTLAKTRLVGVSVSGVDVEVDGEVKFIGWQNLRLAAADSAPGNDVRAVYASLMRDAEDRFRGLSKLAQGVEVVVKTRTGGATWVAEVYDGMGTYRRDLMRADEGMDDPHRWLAEKGGREMARRIGCPMRVVGV